MVHGCLEPGNAQYGFPGFRVSFSCTFLSAESASSTYIRSNVTLQLLVLT